MCSETYISNNYSTKWDLYFEIFDLLKYLICMKTKSTIFICRRFTKILLVKLA